MTLWFSSPMERPTSLYIDTWSLYEQKPGQSSSSPNIKSYKEQM